MKVVPAGEVLVQRDDGEAFLLHVESGRYFGLNRSALVIWEAIAAGTDPVAALARRWPAVDGGRHRADADAFVDALLRAGVARPAAGAGIANCVRSGPSGAVMSARTSAAPATSATRATASPATSSRPGAPAD